MCSFYVEFTSPEKPEKPPDTTACEQLWPQLD